MCVTGHLSNLRLTSLNGENPLRSQQLPRPFRFRLPSLKAGGHQCFAIAQGGRQGDGVPLLQWKSNRSSTSGILDLAVRAEADLIRGRAAADRALQLSRTGSSRFVIGHPAWGETTFMKEIFPKARQIMVGEFYYRSTGGDVGFDPEFKEVGVRSRSGSRQERGH